MTARRAPLVMQPLMGADKTLALCHHINGAVRLSVHEDRGEPPTYLVETSDDHSFLSTGPQAAMARFRECCGAITPVSGYALYGGLLPPARGSTPTILDIGASLEETTAPLVDAAMILSLAVTKDRDPALAARAALGRLLPAFAKLAGAMLELEEIQMGRALVAKG